MQTGTAWIMKLYSANRKPLKLSKGADDSTNNKKMKKKKRFFFTYEKHKKRKITNQKKYMKNIRIKKTKKNSDNN